MDPFKKVFCAFLLLFSQEAVFVRADENAAPPPPQARDGYHYDRPGWFTWLKNEPADVKDFWKGTFRKENTGGIVLMAVGTGLLIAADQRLYEGTYRWGTREHVSHRGQQKPFFKTTLPWSHYTVRLSGPYNLGTDLYFLGDGITHFSIAGGFLAFGLVRDDNRALQTSSQLVESIIATGFVVQVLKHVTGREDPVVNTRPGGLWRFFPNQRDYAKHVNKYDAFPTGQLATAMATVTVIAENYPEYTFVRPLGYTLMTACGLEMVNNGVHWYSDYPLGIYLGYAFAQIAVRKGRKVQDQRASSLEIYPAFVGNTPVMEAAYRFSFKTAQKDEVD